MLARTLTGPSAESDIEGDQQPHSFDNPVKLSRIALKARTKIVEVNLTGEVYRGKTVLVDAKIVPPKVFRSSIRPRMILPSGIIPHERSEDKRR